MTVADFDHIALPTANGERGVRRTGGTANGVSLYARDPDDNLVECLCGDEPPVGRIF